MEFAILNADFENMRANYVVLENTTCELKLKLAATRSSLDDSEFAKKQLQKQLTAVSTKTPSMRSFGGLV